MVGVWPLVNTGKAWASLPHFSCGGMLARKGDEIQGQKQQMISVIDNINREKLPPGFYHLDLDKLLFAYKKKVHSKLFVRMWGNPNDTTFTKSEKIIPFIELPEDASSLFYSLNANLRRKIRKANKNKLTLKTGGLELLRDFYAVYSENIYFLKSLNYGKKFFKDLFNTWQYGNILFFVAYLDGIPAGSALFISYGNFYENQFFATIPVYRRFYVSDWLHWQMINYAIDDTRQWEGEKVYSFGRSTRLSTVHHYKSHWTAKGMPLSVYSDINNIRKYILMKNIWGTLPRFISIPVGAKLIKHIY
jgi:hypothetical protein